MMGQAHPATGGDVQGGRGELVGPGTMEGMGVDPRSLRPERRLSTLTRRVDEPQVWSTSWFGLVGVGPCRDVTAECC